MPKTWDVAVVGAGVFGAWIAYSVRKSGKSVVLLDGYGPANSRASSGGESRIIRMGYGPQEKYTRWSMRSLVMWQHFFDEIADRTLFYRTGVLWTAREGDAFASATREVLGRCGVTFDILNAGEVQRRFSQARFRDPVTAIYEPESGVLMARRAVQSIVRESVRVGVEFVADCIEPPSGHGRLTSVRTRSGSEVAAGQFVFACGPWLPKIFREWLGDRIRTSRQEVYFFGVPAGESRFRPPAMPVWLDFSDARRPYTVPELEGRGFKLALDEHGRAFDADMDSRMVVPEAVVTARAFLAERFPALADAPLVESRVCQYGNTDTGDFVIERHPELQNVWVAGGGSGHGFKHGPVVGEEVARMLV